MRLLSLLFFSISVQSFLSAQTVFGTDSLRFDSTVFFQEIPYHISGQDSLMLDWYPGSDSIPGPTILYVHGGGFYTGSHRNPGIVYFCDSMRNLGFQVASMGYRLHLKGQDFHCDQPTPNKIRAVDTAAEDILRALDYLDASKESLNLDLEQVVLIGSSAGAEAVLQGMYAPGEGRRIADYNIAAIVSLAGAIADTTWINKGNAVPTQFFHGTCDQLVPFGSAIHHFCPETSPGAWPLHGSWTMHQRLEELGVSNYLYIACGEGHRLAGKPMQENIPDISGFLWQVLRKELEIHSIVVSPGPQDCPYHFCPLCE